MSDGDQSAEPITIEFTVTDDVDSEFDLTVTATLNPEVFASGKMSEVGTYKLKITAADTSGNEIVVEVEFEPVGGGG